MRKSPLSAPQGGNYGRDSKYNRNFRNRSYGYDDEGREGCSGYGEQRNEGNGDDDKSGACFSPTTNLASPKNLSEDFIPLGFSSPAVNHRPKFNSPYYRGRANHSHGFYNSPGYYGVGSSPSPRGGRAGFGFSPRNSFHHDKHNSGANDRNSAKFYHQKHQFGSPRTPHQKDTHRNVDVSRYLNLKSTLEDPWADLMDEYAKSRDKSEEDTQEACKSEPSEKSSCTSILIGDLTVKSDVSELDSENLETKTTDNEVKTLTIPTPTTAES